MFIAKSINRLNNTYSNDYESIYTSLKLRLAQGGDLHLCAIINIFRKHFIPG